MDLSNWDSKFMAMAENVATWSKDPSSKIGAIAVSDDYDVLSIGYNGFPRGVLDTPERLNNRDIKLKLVVHAEQNCIYNSSRNGVSLKGSTLYVHGLPTCFECAKAVIQSGIKCVVVSEKAIKKSEFWEQQWEMSKVLLDEANIKYEVFIDG